MENNRSFFHLLTSRCCIVTECYKGPKLIAQSSWAPDQGTTQNAGENVPRRKCTQEKNYPWEIINRMWNSF